MSLRSSLGSFVKYSATENTSAIVFPMHMKQMILTILTFTATLASLSAEEGPYHNRIIESISLDGRSSLGSLSDILRKESGVNIALAPGLYDLPAPTLSLTNVTAKGVLATVATLMPELSIEEVGGQGSAVITIRHSQAADKPKPVKRVTRILKASESKLPDAEFTELLKNFTEAVQLACITHGRSQNPQANEYDVPEVEAHSPTGIIIVAGSEDSVQLAVQVISALGGEAMNSGDSTASSLYGPKHPVNVSLTDRNRRTISDGGNVTLQLQEVDQAIKAAEQARKTVEQMQQALKGYGITVTPGENGVKRTRIEVVPTVPSTPVRPKK